MTGPSVDGVLVEWGERLFYPSSRIVASRQARLRSGVGARAAVIRDRIRATVVRRAPQVMVKVTGGGRGMAAIAAHFRYIARGGRLPFEDDRGVVSEGKEGLRELVWQWQYGGSYIAESSPASTRNREGSVEAWTHIARGLAASDDPADRALAQGVEQYVRSMPFVRTREVTLDKAQARPEVTLDRGPSVEAADVSIHPIQM